MSKFLKTMILFGFMSIMMASLGLSQNTDVKAIKQTIKTFAGAADAYDTDAIDTCTDDHYRIVMNRLFGSKGVGIVDKATYLKKIESKEWGGDKRSLSFENITVNGASASAKVTLKGEKATFVSTFTLIKDGDGVWKLVEDVPTVL
ncbi:MAG: nuclear transport factor 2 family protein [Bacteroidota bacterium]